MGGHNQISRPRVTGSAQERGGRVLSRAEGTMLGLSAQPCLLPFNLFPPWVLPDQGHRALDHLVCENQDCGFPLVEAASASPSCHSRAPRSP